PKSAALSELPRATSTIKRGRSAFNLAAKLSIFFDSRLIVRSIAAGCWWISSSIKDIKLNQFSSENQPRRNEEHEDFFCFLFVFFVSSRLNFTEGRRAQKLSANLRVSPRPAAIEICDSIFSSPATGNFRPGAFRNSDRSSTCQSRIARRLRMKPVRRAADLD